VARSRRPWGAIGPTWLEGRLRPPTSASPRFGVETIRRAAAVHPISDLQIEYSLISRGIRGGDPARGSATPRHRDHGPTACSFTGSHPAAIGRKAGRGRSRFFAPSAHASRARQTSMRTSLLVRSAGRGGRWRQGHQCGAGRRLPGWAGAKAADYRTRRRRPAAADRLAEAVGAIGGDR